MSAWPGKYVIGLTGNIATGKSVVRKMLEHLGAYGIDADALGHRAIAKDAPGYKAVVDTFGRWILAEDRQIDRAKLARVVFADPEALKRLEAMVHPFVRQAVDILVRRSTQSVVVVEAIKLLESPLRQSCDSIWVTYSPPEIQLGRLIQKRKMNEDAARQRINAQDPQEHKTAVANIVIRNDSSYEDTWKQVSLGWANTFPSSPVDTTPIAAVTSTGQPAKPSAQGKLTVEKARPRQAAEIASLISRLSGETRKLTSADIMEAFGEKAFIFLKMDDRPIGVVGWQVENLVARSDDLYLDPAAPVEQGLRVLLEQVEETSRDLQCEALLLFLPPNLARQEKIWHSLGYELRTVNSLGVRAWQEAAQENLTSGEVMLFKQLRKDRVLRPV
jgi:dephospho-CoA kinase